MGAVSTLDTAPDPPAGGKVAPGGLTVARAGDIMVLRIHFTAEDLTRMRVAAAPDPLWEVLLSGFRLQESDTPLEYRPWLRQVHARRNERRLHMRSGTRLLSVLAPTGPYIPDFLTPADTRHGLGAGLEAIRATPKARLRGEMLRLAELTTLPSWIRPLAEGEQAFLAWFTDELRGYYDTVIAPFQELVQGSVDADRTRRVRDLADHGVEGLFRGLEPMMRWRPPVLEVDFSVDQDLYLNRCALLLVPSFFSRRTPDSLADPDLPPVLVYPLDLDPAGRRWPPSARAARWPHWWAPPVPRCCTRSTPPRPPRSSPPGWARRRRRSAGTLGCCATPG